MTFECQFAKMGTVNMFLTQRQEKLLNILIDRYIKTAEPVSSKALVISRFFDLSSATIRNEMNDLEQMGYLAQLHTSGGRVPTDRAYRFYVDNLIGSDDFNINSSWQKKVDSVLASISNDPRDINKTVAQLLSDLSENIVITGISEQDDFYKTGLAGLFELPEFREINKVFRLTSFFDEFDRVFDQIETEFFGPQDTSPVRSLTRAIGASPEDLQGEGSHRGTSVGIASGEATSNGINIFIGHENRHPSIRDETVMTVRYNLPRHLTGSLTLIGPTRMDYRKNIGLVRYTTDKINNLTRKI